MSFSARFLIIVFLFAGFSSEAQHARSANAAEINHQIKKLNVVGTALYLAAHPDDENTAVISWLANDQKLRTGYLSLTRGDGGQNLIGPEIREKLGVIRTQELLMARNIDGGEQFFTRANDFGYSKDPNETFGIWDKNLILEDVVWVIRKFRPDVIITRFPHTPHETHGHHTASAILAYEAFEAASDPARFPHQLDILEPWQAKRIILNTSKSFYNSEQEFSDAKNSDLIGVDVGTYYPVFGKSNNEIAAESRSQHKCQGMGTAASRGVAMEYFELVRGEPMEKTILDGIDLSWDQFHGGKAIRVGLEKIDESFDPENPWKSVPALFEIRELIAGIDDQETKNSKINDINHLVRQCLALFVELRSDEPIKSPGSPIKLTLELVNRSSLPVVLENVIYNGLEMDETFNPIKLEPNVAEALARSGKILLKEYTLPYWLKKPGSLGMFELDDPLLTGFPENPENIFVRLKFLIGNKSLEIVEPIVFKKTDPVKGDVYTNMVIAPPVSVNLSSNLVIFPDDQPKSVTAVVKSHSDSISGKIKIEVPEGWKTEPSFIHVNLSTKGEEQRTEIHISPAKVQSKEKLEMYFEEERTRELVDIAYDHIPRQVFFPETSLELVRLDLKTAGTRIGYLPGAGDVLPESLVQVRFDVDILDEKAVSPSNLKKYDAVILGVRTFNTLDRIRFMIPDLLKYVHNGGTMIVQYNTPSNLKSDKLGPFPFELSSLRITDETAKVHIIEPDHPALNYPNQITEKDFEGWVQERGLYFPSSWDKEYVALLSSSDPGEEALTGGLLIAPYGKGHYVYTGYSWFRQLPAGVPGAFRILANLIALSNVNPGEE